MKERLYALVRAEQDQTLARRLAREYLQHYMLYVLFRTKHYRQLVFAGGTALRILFGVPRFSEDLDFSLAEESGRFDFSPLRRDLLHELAQAGYHAEEKASTARNVVNTFVKFPRLPYELGLSGHRDEALSVKIEVDTRPPAGGRTQLGLVTRYHMMYQVLHYDLPTMLAGKLHALCFRRYPKGRDLYDLLWLLSSQSGLEPNLEFLNNAAAQTEKSPPVFGRDSWRSLVAGRLSHIDLARGREQVRPFLERPEEADLLTLETFRALLRR